MNRLRNYSLRRSIMKYLKRLWFLLLLPFVVIGTMIYTTGLVARDICSGVEDKTKWNLDLW